MECVFQFAILTTTPCCLIPGNFSHFYFLVGPHKAFEHVSADLEERRSYRGYRGKDSGPRGEIKGL